MSSKKKPFQFQDGLDELTHIIDEMESGDLSLEVSLEKYEKAINLTRQCQNALKSAEQKVQILQEKQDVETLGDFDISDEA